MKEEYHKIATVYDPENVKTADATVDVLLGPLPKFARPFGQQASIVLLDDRVRTAFGWQRASPSLLYWLVPATPRLRALVVRYLLYPRTEPPAFLPSSRRQMARPSSERVSSFSPGMSPPGLRALAQSGTASPEALGGKARGFSTSRSGLSACRRSVWTRPCRTHRRLGNEPECARFSCDAVLACSIDGLPSS